MSACQCTVCRARAGDPAPSTTYTTRGGSGGTSVTVVSGGSSGGASTSITLGGAAALRPGDESTPRPCCHRIGDWWCILPDGHPGPHDAPAPRELPAVDFGPRAATSTRRGS